MRHPVARLFAVVAVVVWVATVPPVGAHPLEELEVAPTRPETSAGAGPSTTPAAHDQAIPGVPTPKAECGPGSNPETGLQGRVTADDIRSGRAAQGYSCNTEKLARFGETGGYKVERYVDSAGRECAYYDTTLVFPGNLFNLSQGLTGTYVLDMSNPSRPVRTATLVTPAMQSPHESVSLNARRGLLAAVTANPAFYPGVIDVYDVSADCRNPILKATAPIAGLGHEGVFSPDGRTFWSASFDAGDASPGATLVAVDVANPMTPLSLWVGNYDSHGLSISDDGNRAYLAVRDGLVILDVSDVNARKLNPQVREVSWLTWPDKGTPQVTHPVTIGGHPYLVEMDEFGSGDRIGAARIIDIANETKPFVVSNIKLEVNMPEHQATIANDPGAQTTFQGYRGHYCSIPSRVDPGVLACTFILSGMRLFDIRDPFHPRELAYFNAPVQPSRTGGLGSNYAMSSVAFDAESGDLWYSDGNSGFYVVRMAKGVWPFVAETAPPGPEPAAPPASLAATDGGPTLPATGGAPSVAAAGLAATLAVVLRSMGARGRQNRPRKRF